jgi:tetratricopeptide (TPR) repeat protein
MAMVRLLPGLLALVWTGAAAAQTREEQDRADAHYEQGKAYFRVGAYDQAIEEFTAGYALVPKPGALFNMARCHEELGDKQAAIWNYKRFIDADAGSAAVAEARARVLVLERELAEAEAAKSARAQEERKAAEAAAKIASQVAAADRHFAAGAYDQAIEAYRAAYTAGSDPELVFKIAEAYRKKGDKPAAVVEYVRYRELAPAGPHAADALRQKIELEQQIAIEIERRTRRDVEDGDARRGGKPPAGATTKPAEPAPAPERPGQDDRPRGSRGGGGSGKKIAGLALLGLGLAGIGGGVFLGMKAKALGDEVSAAEDSWSTELDRKVADGEAAQKNMYIALGAGGAAVVGGTLLLLLSRPSGESAAGPEPPPTVELVPTVVPGAGAGVLVRGSF